MSLDYFHVFYRDKGEPQVETDSFDIPGNALTKPHHLVVCNGNGLPTGRNSEADKTDEDGGGGHRVSAGSINLNDVAVSSPSDFSRKSHCWSIPVSLQEHNSLAVRLQGKPGGRIEVAVTHD